MRAVWNVTPLPNRRGGSRRWVSGSGRRPCAGRGRVLGAGRMHARQPFAHGHGPLRHPATRLHACAAQQLLQLAHVHDHEDAILGERAINLYAVGPLVERRPKGLCGVGRRPRGVAAVGAHLWGLRLRSRAAGKAWQGSWARPLHPGWVCQKMRVRPTKHQESVCACVVPNPNCNPCMEQQRALAAHALGGEYAGRYLAAEGMARIAVQRAVTLHTLLSFREGTALPPCHQEAGSAANSDQQKQLPCKPGCAAARPSACLLGLPPAHTHTQAAVMTMQAATCVPADCDPRGFLLRPIRRYLHQVHGRLGPPSLSPTRCRLSLGGKLLPPALLLSDVLPVMTGCVAGAAIGLVAFEEWGS